MDDRKLLELAAKAIGITYSVTKNGVFMVAPYANPLAKQEWNPLTDDGDALRLAVNLGLVVDCSRPSAGRPFYSHIHAELECQDHYAATRRAIVRAAAAIGEQMP